MMLCFYIFVFFFFSSRRRHTRCSRDWSSDVCFPICALASVVRQRVRLTAVGLPLFLWFSTRLFGGLRAALNEVFDTDERRSWPIAKVLDLAKIGRASCRERVYIPAAAMPLTNINEVS